MSVAFARCPTCRGLMRSEVRRGEVSFHCGPCGTDWPIQRRAPTADELMETRSVVTIDVCVGCDTRRRIHARGRCATCYKRWWSETIGPSGTADVEIVAAEQPDAPDAVPDVAPDSPIVTPDAAAPTERGFHGEA